MRPPLLRASFDLLPGEIVVDNFAGGGGASTGIEQAIGRPVDIAVNHDPEAIAMHRANHPETRHYCENVWTVDPREAASGRPVGLAWFSPDCTHHSKAKGGKPRAKGIRGLAWVVIRWARTVRPRIIFLENVEEFADWGPLDNDGRPDPARLGRTFSMWRGKLAALGYHVEHRLLVAADYGAPTTRKRLFLVARCDGQPVVWPEATHPRATWRSAAEIIDWSIPCPSIFERRRPLAPATLRRIAAGIQRYVIDAAQPFIVPVTHPRDARVHSIDDPLRTITAAARGEFALVSPTLIQTGYGERPGQAPRVPGLEKPLGTVVAGGAKHALVAALLTKHYGGVVGHSVERPLGTITTKDHHSVTAAFLTKYYGTATHGADAGQPLQTVTTKARFAEVRALLVKHGPPAAPNLFSMLGPARRPGVVMVDGEPYQIADVGMRMLVPRELFNGNGFPTDYIIDPLFNGKPLTKTAQIDKCGNSVSPPVALEVVAANTRGGLARRSA